MFLRFLVVAGASLGVSACNSNTFQCTSDTACVVDNAQGFCESDGYCSFPDDGCDSGRRYGEFAGNIYAGQCVPALGTSSTSPGTTETPTSVGTTLPTASVTTEVPSSSTTDNASTSSSSSSSGSSSTGEPVGGEHNFAFITSEPVIPGDLGSLAAADDLCNELASAENLPGTYVAWMSSSTESALDRLEGARGWIRVDGRPIADRRVDLTLGRMFHPINVDEAETLLPGRTVATGTLANGLAASTTCDDWTNPAAEVRTGRSGHTFVGWTTHTTDNCTDPKHVYCFGTDLDNPLVIEPAEGRVAFASTMRWMGDASVAAYDQQCNVEAGVADLPGTYLAFIAASGPAINRFDLAGPTWVNTAGIPIVDSANDFLVSDSVVAPVQFDAAGEPSGNVLAWTGAVSPTADGTQTCDQWGDPAAAGLRGYVNRADTWMNNGSGGCTEPNAVLCFEE